MKWETAVLTSSIAFMFYVVQRMYNDYKNSWMLKKFYKRLLKKICHEYAVYLKNNALLTPDMLQVIDDMKFEKELSKKILMDLIDLKIYAKLYKANSIRKEELISILKRIGK